MDEKEICVLYWNQSESPAEIKRGPTDKHPAYLTRISHSTISIVPALYLSGFNVSKTHALLDHVLLSIVFQLVLCCYLVWLYFNVYLVSVLILLILKAFVLYVLLSRH